MIDLHPLCKDLFVRLLVKQISQEEFHKECALLALNPASWNELIVQDYPLKSQAIEEYENLPLTQKNKLTDDYKEQFKSYYRQENAIRAKNWSKYSWLKEMQEILKDDEVCVKRIDERLIGFREWLLKNTRFINA